jgi:hypothetical protein
MPPNTIKMPIVNMQALEPMVCENCGAERVIQVLSHKFVPAPLSANGQAHMVPYPNGLFCLVCEDLVTVIRRSEFELKRKGEE